MPASSPAAPPRCRSVPHLRASLQEASDVGRIVAAICRPLEVLRQSQKASSSKAHECGVLGLEILNFKSHVISRSLTSKCWIFWIPSNSTKFQTTEIQNMITHIALIPAEPITFSCNVREDSTSCFTFRIQATSSKNLARRLSQSTEADMS